MLPSPLRHESMSPATQSARSTWGWEPGLGVRREVEKGGQEVAIWLGEQVPKRASQASSTLAAPTVLLLPFNLWRTARASCEGRGTGGERG